MTAKPAPIDAYLAALSADKRAALEKLRKTIQAAAPRAEECISYGLAAFRLDGKALVAFGATANHCAFFPMSSTTVAAHKDELGDYKTSKGTIRFQADKPLPVALVRKLVKARIAENALAASKKSPSAKAARKAPPTRATAKREPRQAAGKDTAKSAPGSVRTDAAVSAFLHALKHPRKQELETVRQLILGVSPDIREGIKWNAPSFRTTEYFATINIHGQDRIRLILHRGAKAKDNATVMQIADPAGLLEWLARDRCLVSLGDAKDIQAKQAALQAIVRAWIGQL